MSRRRAAPNETVADDIELRGSLDSVEADGRVFGWCWSPNEPDQRRRVAVLVDGREATVTVADLLRADLLTAGIGDGGHGLMAEIPAAMRENGSAADVALRDAATGRPIGAECVVTWAEAAHAPPPLAGNVDLITRDGWVSGWCWDPAAPERRLTLDVRLDDVVAGSVEAAEARADLRDAEVGDGQYGFNFMLPYDLLADRGAVSVAVVEHATGRPLGEPAVLRIGRRSDSESRIQELERQITVMRSRLEQVARAADQQPELEARSARTLFATVAAFFGDLADGTDPAAVSPAGVTATLAELRRTLTPLSLRSATPYRNGRPRATIAVAPGPVEAVHACLVALREAGVDLLAEIVLLDPAGVDARAALLPVIVEHLRAGATPRAVAAFARILSEADTPLVGLVSPDVRAEPGWLEALTEALDDEPRAAMVGGIVVRDDGLLHHAGLELDGDHRLRDLGHLALADLAEHRVLRPIDALAPLALVADRRRVAGTGGLDATYQRLAPALADLCLRVRAGGGLVLRQAGGVARWAGSDTPEAIDDGDGRRLRLSILRHARDARAATHFVGHALVVDAELPATDRDAGSVAALEQMLVLRRLGWRVTFAAAGGGKPAERDRSRMERSGIEVVDAAGQPGVTDILRERGTDLQLVHLYRHRVATLLLPRVRDLAPDAKILFSPADLHFLREARQAAVSGGQTADRIADTKSKEIACVREADATILLSDHERDVLAADVDPARLHVLRWIVRPHAIVPPFAARQGVLFVGNFRHAPNVDAILWYANEVQPILTRMRPGLVTDVVGADAPASILALRSDEVRVRGWVADLAEVLAQVRLTVAPLRYGAGFKGKVATSLAAGVPVVGTSIAFEGSGLAAGDGIASVDSAEEFARAIIRVHDEETVWRELSNRALERVAALYSPDAAENFFRGLLSGLGLKTEPAGPG